ncbi:type II secretion system F family protein [Brevibacterium spongiae]|uniref:Type II secretion system F family protein n=1 Tax=Brevibacterium spongiae TaxID=2909672 RepID=A0ABY5SVG6_9MICO|nr:type II secretion system F family protein [Brevibacterium spongiae]UVI37026.1 type II secretion system F family protein [Brevibacterium spongiae]
MDADDDAPRTEVMEMLPVLIGACIGIGVLLWAGSTDRRLRSLLGERGTGHDPTDTEAAPTGEGPVRSDARPGRTGPGPSGGRTARAVADDQLAFDLDLVAICLTSGLPIPVALTLTAEATGDRSGLQRIGRAMTIGGRKLADDDRLLPVLEVFEFSEHTGVGPAPLIESVAKELRASSRRRRQEAAAALGVQLVLPLGVCILPAFLLLSVVPVVISLLSDLTTVFF